MSESDEESHISEDVDVPLLDEALLVIQQFIYARLSAARTHAMKAHRRASERHARKAARYAAIIQGFARCLQSVEVAQRHRTNAAYFGLNVIHRSWISYLGTLVVRRRMQRKTIKLVRQLIQIQRFCRAARSCILSARTATFRACHASDQQLSTVVSSLLQIEDIVEQHPELVEKQRPSSSMKSKNGGTFIGFKTDSDRVQGKWKQMERIQKHRSPLLGPASVKGITVLKQKENRLEDLQRARGSSASHRRTINDIIFNRRNPTQITEAPLQMAHPHQRKVHMPQFSTPEQRGELLWRSYQEVDSVAQGESPARASPSLKKPVSQCVIMHELKRLFHASSLCASYDGRSGSRVDGLTPVEIVQRGEHLAKLSQKSESLENQQRRSSCRPSTAQSSGSGLHRTRPASAAFSVSQMSVGQAGGGSYEDELQQLLLGSSTFQTVQRLSKLREREAVGLGSGIEFVNDRGPFEKKTLPPRPQTGGAQWARSKPKIAFSPTPQQGSLPSAWPSPYLVVPAYQH